MRLRQLLPLLFVCSLPTFAGVGPVNLTVVYSGVASTPTLSQTLLIALALLLPVVAFRALRKVQFGGSFGALALAVGLLTSEMIGYRWLPALRAGDDLSNFNLTAASGGTLNITNQLVFQGSTLTNTSGATLVLRSLTVQMFLSPFTILSILPGAGRCVVGTTLAPGASCQLFYDVGA